MMKYSKELKIGVFVVVVLVASFFLINYLRGEDLFNREIELVSRYEKLEGLTASAPVYIKGYKAGKVSEVTYMPETDDFEVVCSVFKEFVIPSDSRMTIYSVDIMGGKGVRIDLGNSPERVSDGDFLQPSYEVGLMDGLAANLTPLFEKVSATLDSLNMTVSGVNRILTEHNTESVSRTIAHIEKTMGDVRSIAASVEGKSNELESFIENLAEFSAAFDDIAEKVDTTMTTFNSFMGDLNDSDIEGLVDSFKSLVNNINDPDGTIGKILSDDSVYNSVDSLLTDIDELVRKIQENPKKYIRISVF